MEAAVWDTESCCNTFVYVSLLTSVHYKSIGWFKVSSFYYIIDGVFL